MSHHRYPTCPISGKVRYGERKDIKLELRHADRDRFRAALNDLPCSRREIRTYHCTDCGGWHLTSQPARPVRLLPAVPQTEGIPGRAAAAPRRVLAATGFTAGNAA